MPSIRIIASIEEKYRDELGLYVALYALCQEHERAVSEGSAEEVLRLTRAKQDLMRKIKALELEIQALRSSLAAAQTAAPGAERGGVVKENDKQVVALNTDPDSEETVEALSQS
jgi:hypothetical protein